MQSSICFSLLSVYSVFLLWDKVSHSLTFPGAKLIQLKRACECSLELHQHEPTLQNRTYCSIKVKWVCQAKHCVLIILRPTQISHPNHKFRCWEIHFVTWYLGSLIFILGTALLSWTWSTVLSYVRNVINKQKENEEIKIFSNAVPSFLLQIFFVCFIYIQKHKCTSFNLYSCVQCIWTWSSASIMSFWAFVVWFTNLFY